MRSYHGYVSAQVMSGTVGATLLLLFPLLWSQIVIPEQYKERVLIGAILFSIALITLVVYQIFHIYDSARLLAKNITQSILTYSHELFTELFRNSPVPYMVIDEKGIVESANFSSARLFNVDINFFHGIRVFEYVVWDESPKAALVPEYYTQGKFVNDIEALVKRPDGNTKWVLLSLFSFKDTNGSKKGMLTLVDITKQKLVDKAKTEFVSLASHQLRTPISAMRWNVELLEASGKESFNDLQSAYIEKIGRSLERMDTLIGDFLSASKLELGTLTAHPESLRVTEFFATVFEEYRGYAEKRGVKVVSNWQELSGNYTSDSHLLNMIVSNILGNAIKYTKSGGAVRVLITHTNEFFEVHIEDNGIGIPDNDQELIFSKLFRASNAQTQETDGTGLGLYIVREAAHILGGDITFTSKEGVGTTFIIRLPA